MDEKYGWPEKVKRYLDELYTARSPQELADVLDADIYSVRRNLKRMEQEGHVWAYKMPKYNETKYIRRLPWNELD